MGSFDTLWPQGTLPCPAKGPLCTAGSNFRGNISVVSFLGHMRCKWFQGYFNRTPFANNIQFLQNLNRFCFWKLCHCSILFIIRVQYVAHSNSNMLLLPAPCVIQSPKGKFYVKANGCMLLSRGGILNFSSNGVSSCNPPSRFSPNFQLTIILW